MSAHEELYGLEAVRAHLIERLRLDHYGWDGTLVMTATYSPEDNKLRLSSTRRLDAETYARVKAAGFAWAPKQQIFVAPMWTPEREDLALELAGEIDDEDTSLVERAEERAERFEGYSERRGEEAQQAYAGVKAISDGIPLGQPILVGHHSERRARKDAERIENGMRRAVNAWKTAEYWEQRARGAIRHAKYKERPDVRARRIKGIEADKRKAERSLAELTTARDAWLAVAVIEPEEARQAAAVRLAGGAGPGIRMPRKDGDRPDFNERPDGYTALTNGYPGLYAPRTLAEVLEVATAPETWAPRIERYIRWIEHYSNRLTYERAMLADGGGLVADKFNFAVGGRVCRRGDWFVVTKVNRKAGAVVSLSVVGHWCSTVQVEEVSDYRPPAAGDAEKVEKAMKPLPLCNWRAPGCVEMTTAKWKEVSRCSDAYAVRNFTAAHEYRWRGDRGEGGEPCVYRQRSIYSMGKSTVTPVFLTDAKVTEPPAAPREPVTLPAPPMEAEAEAQAAELERLRRAREAREAKQAEAAPFQAMAEALRTGAAVQVVSAPQLFPTPPELAAWMVEAAAIEPGNRVLEPSAGTGRLLQAIQDGTHGTAIRTAVEINFDLCSQLRLMCDDVRQADFLQCNGDLGKFDRIVMNPPFANGVDIRHIEHARGFLAPGGRLVALCADGPRQRERLRPLAEASGGWYEPLPAGSFAESGTNVNVAMLVIDDYRGPKERPGRT